MGLETFAGLGAGGNLVEVAVWREPPLLLTIVNALLLTVVTCKALLLSAGSRVSIGNSLLVVSPRASIALGNVPVSTTCIPVAEF